MNRFASLYKRHRFPLEIIQHMVWLYHRFNLSCRDIEDLLAERGIVVSYESICLWRNKFEPRYARRPKHLQLRKAPIERTSVNPNMISIQCDWRSRHEIGSSDALGVDACGLFGRIGKWQNAGLGARSGLRSGKHHVSSRKGDYGPRRQVNCGVGQSGESPGAWHR